MKKGEGKEKKRKGRRSGHWSSVTGQKTTEVDETKKEENNFASSSKDCCQNDRKMSWFLFSFFFLSSSFSFLFLLLFLSFPLLRLPLFSHRLPNFLPDHSPLDPQNIVVSNDRTLVYNHGEQGICHTYAFPFNSIAFLQHGLLLNHCEKYPIVFMCETSRRNWQSWKEECD